MRFRKNKREETKTVWDRGTRCDICKQEIIVRGYDHKTVEIEAQFGKQYPGGDPPSGTRYRLDCCGACFLEKLKPLIEKTFGVAFTESDIWDDIPEEEVLTQPREGSPLSCEHANEVPHVCRCPKNCYCKSNTCLVNSG